jgi:uncharacterized membrane protein
MGTGNSDIEPKADILLSVLLRVGVLVCAAIIATGWMGNLIRPAEPEAAAIPQLLRGELLPESAVSHSLAQVAQGLAGGTSRAVTLLGLMLLIALPVARVALTTAAFALERDWLYVALSSTVFVMLIAGLLLGRAL